MPRRPGSTFRRHIHAALILPLLAGLLSLASGTAAQERSERPIGPGVRLLRWTQANGPQALYAVEVDATDPFLRVGVSLGRGATLGLEPLSRQAERLTRPERYPIAGVNGDYFYYPSTQQPGIPTNAAVLDGELIRTPFNRSCLVLDPAGPPTIGLLRARGRVVFPNGVERTLDSVNQPRGANQLVLYTPWYGATTRTGTEGTEVYLEPETFPLRQATTHRAKVRAVQEATGAAPIAEKSWVLSGSGPAGAFLKGLAVGDTVELRVDFDPALAPDAQVLGGGPRLVRDGKVAVEDEGGTLGESFARTRHPRTAIGFNGRKLYLVVVDGRQPGFSAGMSLPELAQVMVELGCTDALNMDGGGSSAIWVRGSILNRPSDGRERPVANGLFVYSTAPKGPPVRLVPSLERVLALAGAETPLAATGEDRYYNPVPLPAGGVEWSVDTSLGSIQDGRFRTAAVTPPPGAEYAEGRITLTQGEARGELPVRVYPRPARVEIVPAMARLGTKLQSPFSVKAYNAQGEPLLVPSDVQWDASPEIGAVTPGGVLTTGEAAGRGTVRAMVNGVLALAQVEVAEPTARPLEDFETAMDWTPRLTAGTTGAVQLAEGAARSGKRALRLEYDLSTGTGTRAVYALGTRALGRPLALKLWVLGDGQGAWLRVRLRDAKGATHMLDAVRKVDWNGTWRELRIPISADLPGPMSLEAIYVVETDAALKPKGALLIDDVAVEQ